MRLFVALPIPKSVKERLSLLQQPMEGVRWQAKNKLHLTLRFLGETDKQQSQQLQKHLSGIKHSPFSLTIKGLGYFPQAGQPRVLWADVVAHDQLIDLQQKVEQLCTSLGFDSEERPFNPHITLARMEEVPKREVNSFIDRHNDFRIADLPVNEFVLYESKLHADGARYERLQSVPL